MNSSACRGRALGLLRDDGSLEALGQGLGALVLGVDVLCVCLQANYLEPEDLKARHRGAESS